MIGTELRNRRLLDQDPARLQQGQAPTSNPEPPPQPNQTNMRADQIENQQVLTLDVMKMTDMSHPEEASWPAQDWVERSHPSPSRGEDDIAHRPPQGERWADDPDEQEKTKQK